METFFALLALCAGNSPITGAFPSQRPVTRSFDVSLICALNKRLSEKSWGLWFETPSRSIWRHCPYWIWKCDSQERAYAQLSLFLSITWLPCVTICEVYHGETSQGEVAYSISQEICTRFLLCCALLCFAVVIHWLIFPYPSGLLHWHCGNLTIAPVPAKQHWCIWINTSSEFIMNDCITTTKQSTTKPCAYFLGYTVSIE